MLTRWSSRTFQCRPPPVVESLPTSSLTSPALRTSRKFSSAQSNISLSVCRLLSVNPPWSSRTVKPHFLLIRQNLRDGNENYKKLLLGFRYSGVGSVNSIQSIYNFQVSSVDFVVKLRENDLCILYRTNPGSMHTCWKYSVNSAGKISH